MSFQPGAVLNTQAFGNRAENVEVPHIDTRAPTSSDYLYPIGKYWINKTANTVYFLTSQSSSASGTTSNWQLVESGASSLLTLSDDANTTVAPVSGNIKLAGTTSEITTTASAGTITFAIPTTFIAPGSIASTTTLTGGTGITATTGNIVASTGNITTTVGSITSATTLTATLGAITATNGNIVRGTAGNKDIYSSVASTTTAGANSAGTVALTGGTATVSTTAVTANSQIRLYRQGIGATGAAALGILTLGTKTAGVSFVINAVQAADATALQASDVSVIGWEIVN